MDVENWRAVPGYENLYEVSDRGGVRSLGRTTVFTDGRVRTFHPRTMKTPHDSSGYPHVGLVNADKNTKYYRVHELVMMAFEGPKPDDAQVIRHLDDNKSNNLLTNLAWGTVSDNIRDMFRNGYVTALPTHCKRGHEFVAENTIVQKDGHRNCRTCVRVYQRLYKQGLRPTSTDIDKELNRELR